MKLFAFLFLPVAVIVAQTAQFPGAVATPSQLKVGINGVSTLLNANANTVQTTFVISACARIAANVLITIDSEIMPVTGCQGTVLVVGSRGFDGTTPATHIAGAIIYANVDAWHHNALSAEVQAIEATLGANLSNIVNVPGNAGTATALKGTLSDQSVSTPSQFITLCVAAVAQGKTILLSQRWDINGTCAASIWAYGNGQFCPTTGHATTLSGAFDGDRTQHVCTSPAGTISFTGAVTAFYPQWFGPAGTCSGPSVDSVLAVQAAIDAAVGRAVVLVGAPSSCAISAAGPGGLGGLTLYPPNSGINLTSNSSFQAGPYVAGSSGGLVAYAANPPTQLLTIYAANPIIHDLYLDGNSGASAHGIVTALGSKSKWTNVIVREFSDDGGQANDFATPTTNLTTGISSGSCGGTCSMVVAATTVNRITDGAYYCPFLAIDVGTVNAEFNLPVTSLAGLTVHLSTTTWAHSHTTSSLVMCQGNTDDMVVNNFQSYSNGGWGWRVIEGPDVGGFQWHDAFISSNALGGEQWVGAVHYHTGGHYSGDNGPAIQLGVTSSATGFTSEMVVDPPTDLEENQTVFNAVVAVCDNISNVHFKVLDQFTFVTSATTGLLPKSCSAYPNGTTTTGYGVFNDGCFYTKNSQGTAAIGSGNCPFTSQGLATLYQSANIICPSANGCDTGHRECTGIGVPDASCPGASANGAIVATLRDSAGNLVPAVQGLRVTIILAHTLIGSSSPNHLNLNGAGSQAIASHLNPGNSITGSYVVSGVIDLMFSNGDWLDMGQN